MSAGMHIQDEGAESPWSHAVTYDRIFHDERVYPVHFFMNRETGKLYGGTMPMLKAAKDASIEDALVDLTDFDPAAVGSIGGKGGIPILSNLRQLFDPGLNLPKRASGTVHREIIHPARMASLKMDVVSGEWVRRFDEVLHESPAADLSKVVEWRNLANDRAKNGLVPDAASELTPSQQAINTRLQPLFDDFHRAMGVKGYVRWFWPREWAPSEFPSVRSASPTAEHARKAEYDPAKFVQDFDDAVHRYVRRYTRSAVFRPVMDGIRIKMALVPKTEGATAIPTLGDVIGRKTAEELASMAQFPNTRAVMQATGGYIYSNVLGSPLVGIADALGASPATRQAVAAIPFLGNLGSNAQNMTQALWTTPRYGPEAVAKTVGAYVVDPTVFNRKAELLGTLEHTHMEEIQVGRRTEMRELHLYPAVRWLIDHLDALSDHNLSAYRDTETANRAIVSHLETSKAIGAWKASAHLTGPDRIRQTMEAMDWRFFSRGELDVLIADIRANDMASFARDAAIAAVDTFMFSYGRGNHPAIVKFVRNRWPELGYAFSQFVSFTNNTVMTFIPKVLRLPGAGDAVMRELEGQPIGNTYVRALDRFFDLAARTPVRAGIGIAGVLGPLYIAGTLFRAGGVDIDDRILFNPNELLQRKPGPIGQLFLAGLAAASHAFSPMTADQAVGPVSKELEQTLQLMLPTGSMDWIRLVFSYNESDKEARFKLKDRVGRLPAEHQADFYSLFKDPFSDQREGGINVLRRDGKEILYSRTFTDALMRQMKLSSVSEAARHDMLTYQKRLATISAMERKQRKGEAGLTDDAWLLWQKLLKVASRMDIERKHMTTMEVQP